MSAESGRLEMLQTCTLAKAQITPRNNHVTILFHATKDTFRHGCPVNFRWIQLETLFINAWWMYRSPADTKTKNESRNSRQRFSLIQNPCVSTAYWIPCQTRDDVYQLTAQPWHIPLRSLRLCESKYIQLFLLRQSWRLQLIKLDMLDLMEMDGIHCVT